MKGTIEQNLTNQLATWHGFSYLFRMGVRIFALLKKFEKNL